MTSGLKRLYVHGFPSLYGGAGTELHHRIILRRKMGTEAHRTPAWDCLRKQQVTEDNSAMAPALYEYDAFGNFAYGYLAGSNLLETLTKTPVKTKTGIRCVTYNAENRPVKLTGEGGSTIVECAYDSMGRRAFRKETTEGAVKLHQRYIYRGYLQIVALDLVKANHPVLWHIIWDSTQPTATRPLAIRNDGARYTYDRDLTENICEVYGQTGYIRTLYTYTPYGEVTADGDEEQPIRWSSEVYDAEPGPVYYNYRYYSPRDGRWTGRDDVEEEDAIGTPYNYVHNNAIYSVDTLGLIIDTIWDVGFIAWDIGETIAGAVTGDSEMVQEAAMDLAFDTAAALIPGVPAGATKLTRAAVKKAARKSAMKKVRKRAEYLAIWQGYKNLNCRACKARCMPCASVRAAIACFSALAAARLLFLRKKCDYYPEGSVSRGSRGAEQGHRKAHSDALRALNKCKVRLANCMQH